MWLAYKFYESSPGNTSIIKPEIWAYFGSTIGGILLIITLVYQIISFNRQQIENKFFELVRFYRDNINEMNLRNPFFYSKMNKPLIDEEKVNGRRVFKVIFDQYCIACKLIHEHLRTKGNTIEIVNEEDIKKEFKGYFLKINKCEENDKQRFIKNDIAYLITYYGLSEGGKDDVNNLISKQYKIKGDIELLRYMPALYTLSDIDGLCFTDYVRMRYNISDSFNIIPFIKMDKYKNNVKFFEGHQYHLGQYFRHLYQAVKYIDRQSPWLLNQTKKNEYIKTLRAQMSNYEQALLFIDSLSYLGRNWGYNEGHKDLITKYKLIKNIPRYFIPEMEPHKYYTGIRFEYQDNN